MASLEENRWLVVHVDSDRTFRCVCVVPQLCNTRFLQSKYVYNVWYENMFSWLKTKISFVCYVFWGWIYLTFLRIGGDNWKAAEGI